MRDESVDLPRIGPGWPILPPTMESWTFISFPAVLWSRGARSWYVGGGFSLLWLISVGQEIVAQADAAASATLGIIVLVLFAVAFLIAPPISWCLPIRSRLMVVAGLWLLSFAMFPWLSWGVASTWTYVGVIIGMSVLKWRSSLLLILGLGALALVFAFLLDGWHENILWAPAIIVSISLMMAAFARTLAAMNELRATQNELERMAVEQERGRVARDVHDILGHSLTVITVKAELARRVVDADPARAAREIGEVEELARGALADVRATVAGYRGVAVAGEVAAARSALESAGIEAELPGSTDAVAPQHRELAGWVVREGVTNVIRHSRASRCRVALSAHRIEIADDGRGLVEGAGSPASTGLDGLRERVEAAGGRLSVGRSDLGGFSLVVTL